MGSSKMFPKWTQNLLQEVDSSGELESLPSLYETVKLDLLSVMKIVEARKFFFFKRKRYHPTEFKLQDLLQSTDTVDFGKCNRNKIVAVDMTEEWRGKSGVKIVASGLQRTEVNCQMHNSSSATEINLESLSVSRCNLQNRKINKNHFLFQKMMKNEKILDLGVVFEVVKNKDPLVLACTTKGEGGATIRAFRLGSVEAEGQVDRTRKLTIDAGCVVAFKVEPLNLRTTKDSASSGRSDMDSDGVAEFAEFVAGDFRRLKTYVEAELNIFGRMDQDVKKSIWNPLYETQKCPEALYALDCMLEEGCISKDSISLLKVPENVKRSVLDLLEKMQPDDVDSSDPFRLLQPVGFLVSALSELEEEAVTLVVDWNNEVRGQVLKLVEGVVEQVCSTDCALPQWRGEFPGEATEMATLALASCGLKLDKDCLDPTLGSPGAPSVILLALYITLKGLHMLLGP